MTAQAPQKRRCKHGIVMGECCFMMCEGSNIVAQPEPNAGTQGNGGEGFTASASQEAPARERCPASPAPDARELLPCPFCGEHAALRPKADAKRCATCTNIGCDMYGISINIDHWNRRATPQPAATQSKGTHNDSSLDSCIFVQRSADGVRPTQSGSLPANGEGAEAVPLLESEHAGEKPPITLQFIIHVLRNPYGHSQEVMRSVRLKAADMLDAEQVAETQAGFVAVPREPTLEMLRCGFLAEDESINDWEVYTRELWKRMLAAAPTPERGQG